MAPRSKPQRYPLVEWASATVGLVVIVAMLGFLTLEAIGPRSGLPPLLEAEATGLVAGHGQYVVAVKVSNSGRRTAAGVGIEGVLKQGDADVETSSASLSYVPGQSHRRGGLIFTRDPRKHQLELRVTGYELP